MTQVYNCQMQITVNFDIRANSAEEVQDWLNTHTIEDLKKLTTDYDIEYDDHICEEINEDFYGFSGVDITDEEVEDKE